MVPAPTHTPDQRGCQGPAAATVLTRIHTHVQFSDLSPMLSRPRIATSRAVVPNRDNSAAGQAAIFGDIAEHHDVLGTEVLASDPHGMEPPPASDREHPAQTAGGEKPV